MPRIIRVQLSDNPYLSDHANTISYFASAHNRIRIIHILIDIIISKTLLHILKIRIKIGLDAEIIHTTFTPTFPYHLLLST
jgi:hypothetical protein